MTLVVSEDVVDETLEVVKRSFSQDAKLPDALQAFIHVLEKAEVVPRREYRGALASWRGRIRDDRDVPIVAAAVHAKADVLVSGDRDILEMAKTPALRVVRTRDLLKELDLDT